MCLIRQALIAFEQLLINRNAHLPWRLIKHAFRGAYLREYIIQDQMNETSHMNKFLCKVKVMI